MSTNALARISRAIYSIDPEVLNRFNSTFRPRERSKIVEQFMRQALAKKERQLIAAVRLIESDPRFAAIREVSGDVDRIAGEAVK